jgi:methionine sulfoxide reductase catalytic subunit
MSPIKRRDWFRYLGATLSTIWLSACGLRSDANPTGVAQAPPTSDPSSTSAPIKEATRTIAKILRNMNRARYNVRFIRPAQALEHETWRLRVEGIVGGPRDLTYDDILALPSVKQNSRMVCVEGWSFRSDWEGFTINELLELVEPVEGANHLRFECVDTYYETLSIDELREDRVLFAHKMDGEPLSDEHGWPVRLIVPPRYGYKGAKSITTLRFTDEGRKGYWSTVGPYTVDGFVETRYDRPQDLPGERFQTLESAEQIY